MLIFNWNTDKNDILKNCRKISFEEIILSIINNNVIDVLDHPNQKDYPGQKMYVINYNDYIYLVPFIKNKNEVFLKTIIPSRKATKQYLGGK